MRIGISALYRFHGGGLTHLRQILRAWADLGIDRKHTVVLFVRAEGTAALTELLNGRVEVRTVGRRPMSLVSKLIWEQLVFPRVLGNTGLDVVFCPGSIVPFRSGVPTVLMIRNAGPFCPSVTPASAGLSDWLWFKVLETYLAGATRVSSRVIFNSQHLRELLIRKFGIPPGRTDLIYHGRDGLRDVRPDPALLRSLNVRPPYLLSVSHLYGYKNFPALLAGFALARARLGAIRLVLAGQPRHARYLRSLRSLIRRYGLDDAVSLVGGVPPVGVRTLQESCEAFVFQSTCENCPTALIEALAAGLPIACANIGVMPEIAGNAVRYFDPYDPRAIADALVEVMEDASLRSELRARAQAQAQRFPTWREVGELTFASLAHAAGEG